MLTFTVNEKSQKGKSLLEFAQKLEANEKDIRIRKFRKITDEEMALPGNPVSEEQLDEWLSRPDKGKNISAEKLLAQLNKKYKAKGKWDRLALSPEPEKQLKVFAILLKAKTHPVAEQNGIYR